MAAKKKLYSKSLIDEVQRWGCMKQTGVSLRYMLEFGSKFTDRKGEVMGARKFGPEDKQLRLCKCGYDIYVWCWHHIMDMAEKDNTEGKQRVFFYANQRK